MEKGEITLYDLNGETGWFLSRQHAGVNFSPVLQLRLSHFENPWRDSSAHFHTTAHEIFLVLNGELWLLIDDLTVRLQRETLLLVPPGVPHAAIGGKGLIQHCIIQIMDPNALDEKQVTEEISLEILDKIEIGFAGSNLDLDPSRGFFADLTLEEHHNCWLIGNRNKYLSENFCLAYIFFKTEKNARETKHPFDSVHYHTESTEWYWTFEGEQQLVVAGETIRIPKNHLLRVGKNVAHGFNTFTFPFRGMTVRTSTLSDKKVEVNP